MASFIRINGVEYREEDVSLALDCFASSKGALEQCERLISEALPKFSWGASALDANAIKLLNEVPIAVRVALAKIRRGG